jgi:hypothetical protein
MRLYALFFIIVISFHCVVSNAHKIVHRSAKRQKRSQIPINSKNEDVDIAGAKLVSCNELKCFTLNKFVIDEENPINCYDRYLEIKYNDSENGYLIEDVPGKSVYQVEDQQVKSPFCKKIKKYELELFLLIILIDKNLN